jgi:Zn finger protein HypA/HybF involved in hydrogenase expression
MADEINPGFVACDDCNRVLAVDDGPTCPECKSEARREARAAARSQARDKDD